MKMVCKIGSLGFLLIFSSCAPIQSQSTSHASVAMTKALGCSDLKSLVFDSFYEMLDQEKTVPTTSQMKESLKIQMEKVRTQKNLSDQQAATLSLIALEMFKIIDLKLLQNPSLNSQSWKEQIQKIIEYEMGDLSSEATSRAATEIDHALEVVKTLSSELQISCEVSSRPSTSFSALGFTSLTQGVNRVFATAYQSCRVLNLPVMDSATGDVQGIQRLTQNHPDGLGGKRIISDLKAVQSTHYYLRGIASESSCMRVSENPLIYDYGGEPALSANNLNFFKDAGTGTTALGIDCSAFVSSAIAVSGYRYRPNLENKPIYTRQTSAKFIDAAASGFSCFDNVTVTPQMSTKPGDIVGVKGHVVIVDRIGKDPFGLALIKNVNDCSNLNYKNFDIDIAQSSPSKNGIGINKYLLRDYLDESPKIRTAFEGMAEQACLAKFQNRNLKPKNSEWGFLRHKGTPDCLTTRVTLSGESNAVQLRSAF